MTTRDNNSQTAQAKDNSASQPQTITDLNEYFDREFLSDFLEQHLPLLDEFEAKLLSLQTEDHTAELANQDSLLQYVNSYLHNIKGDSGTIGLMGIEQVTHFLEEVLLKKTVIDIADQLIVYKQWVADCIESFHVDKSPTSPVSEFFPQLKKAVAPASRTQNKEDTASTPKKERTNHQFVSVETHKLDLLIEMIGEVITSSSMLINNCKEFSNNRTTLKNMDHLQTQLHELQDVGMTLRLVSIEGIFKRMSRVVWEMNKRLNKSVKLVTTGSNMEIDKTVYEYLLDPLMHIVRNAIVHSIESPEIRRSLKKDSHGTITISAHQQRGNLCVKVSDDGQGLNKEAILQQAYLQNLISPSDKLSDNDLFQLIFKPGFSTANEVTDIAGRGVGLDIVKSNLIKVRGKISVSSKAKKGACFTMEIPLALSTIEGVLCQVGESKYLLPISSVIEFVNPTNRLISKSNNKEIFEYRNELIPMLRLYSLFNITPQSKNPEDGIFVIIEVGDKTVALLVDKVAETVSTTIKSLNSVNCENKGLYGGAILPDGKVSLILDCLGLWEISIA